MQKRYEQLTAKERYEAQKAAAQKAAAQESANTVPPFKWLRPAPLHPATQYVIG